MLAYWSATWANPSRKSVRNARKAETSFALGTPAADSAVFTVREAKERMKPCSSSCGTP